jgi:hypothetical protein
MYASGVRASRLALKYLNLSIRQRLEVTAAVKEDIKPFFSPEQLRSAVTKALLATPVPGLSIQTLCLAKLAVVSAEVVTWTDEVSQGNECDGWGENTEKLSSYQYYKLKTVTVQITAGEHSLCLKIDLDIQKEIKAEIPS